MMLSEIIDFKNPINIVSLSIAVVISVLLIVFLANKTNRKFTLIFYPIVFSLIFISYIFGLDLVFS